MNETERERIMRMLSEGDLRPDEAARLLAALAENEGAAAKKAAPQGGEKDQKNGKEKEKSKPKPQVMEVQRPDGSHYTVEVPPGLVPAILKVAGMYIKESARTATQEAWSGLKTTVRRKSEEVRTTVKEKVSRPGSKPVETPAVSPEEQQQLEARRRILQMVQNGRITATDASRLIQQVDALREYQKSR